MDDAIEDGGLELCIPRDDAAGAEGRREAARV